VKFVFVEREKAHHSVTRLCRVLQVSPRGDYAWRRRAPSARARQDAHMQQTIIAVHQRRRGTYGAPCIHADLWASGLHSGRKRVARLMRAAPLVGVHRRRSRGTTQRADAATRVPDRVARAFVAAVPHRLWTADITAIPTQTAWLSLAVVLAVYSRRLSAADLHLARAGASGRLRL